MRLKVTILLSILNLFVYSQNPQGDYSTNKYSIIPPAPEVYKNKEERRNIENVENVVAKELGEPIRTSYSTSGYFRTNDVTEHETKKNKPLEHEINLTPENGYKPIHK